MRSDKRIAKRALNIFAFVLIVVIVALATAWIVSVGADEGEASYDNCGERLNTHTNIKSHGVVEWL